MQCVRSLALLGLALAAAAAAAGCGRTAMEKASVIGPRPQAQGSQAVVSGTITALVPCGQVGPFSKAYRLFEQKHPGVTVDWEQENIVTMTKKVLDGKARPDAFLSMGDLEMDQLEKAHLLVPGTRTRIAENSLAIVVPAKNPGGVEGIEDLADPSVKLIAVPDPEKNAVGKHMKEALQKVGIWDQVKGKVLLPRFAADSKDLAIEGKVEAAIAYYPCSVEVHVPDAPPALPKSLKLAGHIPSGLYPEFWCEAAVIKGAKNPDGGKALIEFLRTPEVQEIYRQWEFVREPAKAAGS